MYFDHYKCIVNNENIKKEFEQNLDHISLKNATMSYFTLNYILSINIHISYFVNFPLITWGFFLYIKVECLNTHIQLLFTFK